MAKTADLASETALPGGPARARADQLLCIAGDRSFTVTLPASGELLVGRNPGDGKPPAEGRLELDDPSVSRAHARLLVVPDGLRVTDLGSKHGTFVNSEPILEPRLVGSGDVITLGHAMLVVRRPIRSARGSTIAEPSAFTRRLTEALARIAQYERELSLVVARPADADPAALAAALADRLRVIDTVSPVGARFVGVLLPELDAEEAAAFARELSSLGLGRVSAGIATAPYDGIEADDVLGAARAACRAAAPGAVVRARDAAETITAGKQQILVADPAMAQLYEMARRLARAPIPILILGETGAGKELAAAAIHAFSPRSKGPFVSVNCAAIPETLAESELFGHEKGAFTGAERRKEGYFHAADGGTLFLDEIGELSPAMQARLLRVLETGEVMRVGETRPQPLDVRIVAATNRDLQRESEGDRFRRDLFFRLGSARLELPPLRDRPRDLAALAPVLLRDACRALGRPPLELSIGAALALFRYPWPGNIRELVNVIKYAAAAAQDGASELELWHLPKELREPRGDGPAPPAAIAATIAPPPPPGEFPPIADEVRRLERAWMIRALRATNGVQNRAADLIEMPLRTFATKMKRYAITPAEWKGA